MKVNWEPISLEAISGKWLARVDRHIHGGRWRWSVTELEQAKRWPSIRIEKSRALGYARGRERAIRMAEAAIVALGKASS